LTMRSGCLKNLGLRSAVGDILVILSGNMPNYFALAMNAS
jgi:hypothetical protein